MTRVICISGDAASGKTTAAKGLLERLPGWSLVSTGARFREYCARHGISPQQISGLPDDFHREYDQEMQQLLATGTGLIAEARLVGYLAHDLDDALRVFCDCPLEVRAARFRQREPGVTLSEASQMVAERDAADTANFRRLYGIDYHERHYYHLVVNSHTMSPSEVVAEILRHVH